MSGDFSFLKGNIYTIILCSLYGKDGKSGDKYGYEIAKEIKERTDNKYEIKQPTLYAYLKKLEQQEQIESYWGTESNGGRRRYYKLTAKGKHDCEQFIAEWEYHKNVLNTLVDAPETPLNITQEEVTPLFGEKQKRTRTVRTKELDEQDELSKRLDELIGVTEEPLVVPYDAPKKPAKLQQESLFDSYSEEEVLPTIVVEEPQPEVETLVPTSVEQPQESSDDYRAKFDIQQDNADDFMQRFEERARVISETMDNQQQESNENYQHVLMRVIGDQLDDMQVYNSEQQDGAQKYYTDHPVALEDVADDLARQGIRMRIYNHASANFKSRTLMPQANVLCKSAWITFIAAAIYFGILLFTSISIDNWQPYLITLAVVLLVPIALTMYALYDPSRKEKPRFVFGKFLVATGALSVIIVLFALGLSIITRIELSDYASVGTQILVPTGIALLSPIYVVVYNHFYSKY